MRRIFLFGALALAATPVACQRTSQGTLSAEQAAEARRTIVAWLECEECNDGEREAVTRLGETAVPTLAATLSGGLSEAKRESVRQHLLRTHRELKEYERTHPASKVPTTEEEYVRTYLESVEALYRSRAALALGDIGGAQAQRALEAAARDSLSLRSDVRASVTSALQRLRSK